MSAARLLYTIGEFSRVTGITVKALRFYHAEGVLPPAAVDADSAYRYYTPEQVELARAIRTLREVDLPLAEIRAIVTSRDPRERMGEVLGRHMAALEERIRNERRAVRRLQEYLAAERQVVVMEKSLQEGVQEKTLPPTLIAGIRMRGKYSDCGKAFGRLCRGARSALAGSPMLLHYDQEYKENDADFEACIPLKTKRDIAGASVRELPAGRCVSLVHRGPYDTLGESYRRIFDYLKARNYRPLVPSREIYLKGPGMIFRGNPKKYVTEIQIPIEQAPLERAPG